MAERTRPSTRRGKYPDSSRRRKINKNACLDKCVDRSTYKVRDVNPIDVHMTADDVAWARLHDAGRLLWCSACGRVWERYHDDIGLCPPRKIGTFRRWKLPHIFVRYKSPI
jgi:hypothetical protein